MAARAVFAEKGYDGASLEEIVTLAGVSYPTLYHHFGNKNGLYTATAFRAYGEILAQFTARAAKAPDGRSKIQAAIDTGIAMVRKDRMLAMFLHDLPVEIRRHPELSTGREGVLSLRDALRSAVDEGRADGSLPAEVDPERLADVIGVLLVGLQTAALSLPHNEFHELALHVRDLFDNTDALLGSLQGADGIVSTVAAGQPQPEMRTALDGLEIDLRQSGIP